MKKINKLLALSLLLTLPLAGCDKEKNKDNSSANQDNVVSDWNDCSSITLNAMSASIDLGATYQIQASGSGTLTYSSTDESIATVSSSGLVTSLAEGDVAIKVSNGSDFVYFRLHIGEFAGEVVSGVPTLALSSKALTLYQGEVYSLNPRLLVDDKDVSGASYTYASTNESVAKVVDGKVNAIGNGEATITVTGTKGATTASEEVTISVCDNLIYLVPDFDSRQVVAGTPVSLGVALINNTQAITSGVSEPTYEVNDDKLAYISNNQLFAIHKGLVVLSAKVTYKSVEYSFSIDIETKDLYKVTYTVEGVKVYEENVISGEHISYKEIPTKKDSKFKCWADGDNFVYEDTPIDEAMDLEAKWLVYSSDFTSEEKVLLWDYSTGTEIVCTNNTGCYLWEDYQYPDTRLNIQFTGMSGLTTTITLPKFEYRTFPAVSFYLYTQMNGSQFKFGTYTSSELESKSKNQVSIVGNKLYFNGSDTNQTVKSTVLDATEGLEFNILMPTGNSGKMCISGFYCHLAEE